MTFMTRLIGILVVAVTLAGCNPVPTESPAGRVMIESRHSHYHVHAPDVDHGHAHQDFPRGGHTHEHDGHQ